MTTHTNQLARLKQDLLNIQTIEMGRPARYYNAYRLYTIYWGIAALEAMMPECDKDERIIIDKLLKEYHVLTIE